MGHQMGKPKPEETAEGWDIETVRRPLRPSQCRVWMQRTLARNYPLVVRRFLEDATPKSCAHMKMVTELLEADVKTPKRKKDGIDRVLAKWAAEDALAAKRADGQKG
jgi:hypothetical protein